MLPNDYDFELQQNLLINYNNQENGIFFQNPTLPPQELDWLGIGGGDSCSPTTTTSTTDFNQDITAQDLYQIIKDSNNVSPINNDISSSYESHSVSPPINNNISSYFDNNHVSNVNTGIAYSSVTTSLRDNILPSSISDVQPSQVVPAIEPCHSPSNFPIKIEYKVYPEVIVKHQKRVKGKSEQRIKNGIVSFILDFQDVVTFQLIYDISVFVKHTNEESGTPQFIGPVNLKPRFESIDGYKYLIEVDLDSVYEVNGKKVYELQKTLTDELNKYNLIVDVSLRDGRTTKIKTKDFLLLGKENNVVAPKPLAKKKRKKSSSSLEELFFDFSDDGHVSPASSGYGSGRDQDKEVVRAQNIVADYVKTKSLEIDGVLISNKIVSPNGDIAYHFQLNDDYELFEEGEVVGLDTIDNESKPRLIKLTAKNSSAISLKGVITRSMYFEAMKPPPEIKSETVCMMGIIPVKVQGTVYPNDPLYASPKVPGVAVSDMYLSNEEMKYATVIGYAFQSVYQDEYDISLVQAGVSVLSTASQTLLNRRLLFVEQHWETQIKQLKQKNKTFRRRFQTFGFVSVTFIVLVGILLWQLLLPGSAFRYYECKIGSNQGTASFTLEKGKPIFDDFDVNGIEYSYDSLMKKINSKSYEKIGMKGARYYLNVDRCAYGGVRTTIDEMVGAKRVDGTMIFAINKECGNVYSFYEYERKWQKIGGPFIKVKNLNCR